MDEPEWISLPVALAIHDDQLAGYGGPAGVRDHGGLDSALHRPIHLFAYDQPDLAALAGAYAFGLARNHPFIDGNKRTSLVVCLTFLALNGFEVLASDDEKVATWLALADGSLIEPDIAAWLRDHMRPATG